MQSAVHITASYRRFPLPGKCPVHNLSISLSFPLNTDLFVVYLALLFLDYFRVEITVVVDFSGWFLSSIF